MRQVWIDYFQERDYPEVKTILVVEDDEGIGELLVQAIQQETPYQALVASDGFEAMKLLHSQKLDLLILDYDLPGMTGIELYDRVYTDGDARLPAIIVSAQLSPGRKEARDRHLPYLKKPFELTDLFREIERLLI